MLRPTTKPLGLTGIVADYVESVALQICVPEPFMVTLSESLLRIKELNRLVSRAYRWHLGRMTYICPMGLEVQVALMETCGELHFSLPPNANDGVITWRPPGSDAPVSWTKFPFNEMFILGEYDEKQSNAPEVEFREGPYNPNPKHEVLEP